MTAIRLQPGCNLGALIIQQAPPAASDLYNLYSFFYKLRPLFIICVVVAASLGSAPALAQEAQPTPQPLASPTAEAQPTEPPVAEPTAEPTAEVPPTLVPATVAVLPTATFRVIEISTRVPTNVPPPTPIPTLAEPAIGPSPTLAPPNVPSEPVLSPTLSPDEGSPTPAATATIEEPALTAIENPATPTTEQATFTVLPAGGTPTSTPSATVTVTPTEGPYWAPGPECNVAQGKVRVKLPVPYIQQVLDVGGANGNWACGPTSVAMVLAYYGKLQPWKEYVARQSSYTATPTVIPTVIPAVAPAGTPGLRLTQTTQTTQTTQAPTSSITSAPTPTLKAAKTVRAVGREVLARPDKVPSGLDFAPYVSERYTDNGYTYSATALDPSGNSVAGLYGTIAPNGLADWSRMAFVFRQYGLSGRYIPVTWDGIVAALNRGSPVLLGNTLTAAGHIIVVIGYTDTGNLIVNDSYGNRFIPGYGGTRGGGLFYPWVCVGPRNAYEVIGTYPPPTGTAGPVASDPLSALPASISGGIATSRNDTPWLASLLRKNAPPTSLPTTLAAQPPATPALVEAVNAGRPSPTPLAASTPIIGAWTTQGESEQQNALGWGLFSILSLAAIYVGVSSTRSRRVSTNVAVVAFPGAPSDDPGMHPGGEAEVPASPAPASLDAVATPPNVEQEEVRASPVAIGGPAHRSTPLKSGRLSPTLRRGLLLVPSLLLLGLKLYQVSRGQHAGPPR